MFKKLPHFFVTHHLFYRLWRLTCDLQVADHLYDSSHLSVNVSKRVKYPRLLDETRNIICRRHLRVKTLLFYRDMLQKVHVEVRWWRGLSFSPVGPAERVMYAAHTCSSDGCWLRPRQQTSTDQTRPDQHARGHSHRKAPVAKCQSNESSCS